MIRLSLFILDSKLVFMTPKNFPLNSVDWAVTDSLVEYDKAELLMKDRVLSILNGESPELVWLLQHPSIYTAGTSSDPSELIDTERFPVFNTGRGGLYTYHGPGQRVVYLMMNLKNYNKDIRLYIRNLEILVIKTLKTFNISTERQENAIGLWVSEKDIEKNVVKKKKIASIGVRVQRGITFHGLSINLDPNLEHFNGIIPCGIADCEVTSIWNLGVTPSMFDLDIELRKNFQQVFMRDTNFIQLKQI